MKALLLFLALVAIASCRSSQNSTEGNSVEMASNRSRRESASANNENRHCVNLNTATPDELIKLPGVGEVTARRIIDYRERHGRFRRPEEIIIIEGFSEVKYRAVAPMICVE